MSRFTWRKYFLLFGIIIIWGIAGFAGIQALGDADILTAAFSIIVAIAFTLVLSILISLIDRFL
ncbi:MAG: hypothetical protein JSV04_14510 [Candidatus Heimdallarchaeota archaeon]|nr:MAG: hypothetical protein JSV04_14510 [Candidatus Heimdallarchaeota archaeon]